MSIRAAEIYKDILTMKNISEQAQESYVRNLRLVEKVRRQGYCRRMELQLSMDVLI